jgi:hypothetical protein
MMMLWGSEAKACYWRCCYEEHVKKGLVDC